MNKRHFSKLLISEILDTATVTEIIDRSDINENSLEKDQNNLNKIKNTIYPFQEKAGIRGFKIGFDLVMILYGFPPKYYSIWPKND